LDAGLLYSEYLSTEPWDYLLALAVILIVASVPVIVGIGIWIQSRRAEAASKIPWLTERAREEARRRKAS
jgi:hypothetical protein